MPPRRATAETIVDKRRLLEIMRACREEALRSAHKLRPYCETWTEIDMLTIAIDRLAGHLTGDPRLFHAGGSVGPSGFQNGVLIKRDQAR